MFSGNYWRRLLTLLAATCVLALGCTGPKDTADTKKVAARHAQKEEEAPPPHGGALFATDGHEKHAELVVDEAAKKATVYLYDSRLKKAVPIAEKTITMNVADAAAPVQIVLRAEPQEGDPAGSASRFSGTHDALAKKLDVEKVEIEAKIDGKAHVFKPDKDD